MAEKKGTKKEKDKQSPKKDNAPAKANSTTAVGPAGKIQTVRTLLEQSHGAMIAALPKHIKPDKMARVAMTALRTNPKLMEADPMSFLAAVMQLCQVGLIPDGFLGEAYLVPYRKDVNAQIGFRGFIELMKRTGDVQDVIPRVVYDKEPFTYEEGIDVILKHTPKSPSERGKEIVGVYNKIVFKSGYTSCHFMWKEEIDAIRKHTKFDGETSVWNLHYEAMAKKTVIRQHVKYQSLSPELQKSTILDEYGEQGLSTREVFSDEEAIEVANKSVAEKTNEKTDALVEQIENGETVATEPEKSEPAEPEEKEEFTKEEKEAIEKRDQELFEKDKGA